MDIVDTHCHACLSWYEPAEMLVRQMDANAVRWACLVQIKGQYDNGYQEDVLGRYPGRFVSVVHLDASRPHAEAELERLAARGARGLRLLPGDRSPGRDPLAIWKRAAALGLPVTTGGGASAEELLSSGLEDVIRVLPGLTVIIEHLGSGNRPDGEAAPYAARKRVYDLARYPNAFMKFHGLGEFATRAMPVAEPFPFVRPIPPLLDMALERFGPERMMWGSDYPPVSSREGYANALRLSRQHLARLGEETLAELFGGTAKRIYRLDT
jgi:L-fuconolactonase